MSRWATGPGRRSGEPRTHFGPDPQHPVVRGALRPERRSAPPVRAELDAAWSDQPVPRVRRRRCPGPRRGGIVSRVAVVTGGASGIGLGVAQRFVADGHRVAVFDRNGAAAQAAPDDLAANGGTAIGVEVDVADWAAVATAFDQVRAELGPVEI